MSKHFDVSPERWEGYIEPNNWRDKAKIEWVSLFDRYGKLRERVELRAINYRKRWESSEIFIRLCVEEAMRILNDREKQILRHYYWDGLTLQEIGDVFSVSFQRVKQIIDRALEKMRKYLAVETEGILYNGGKYHVGKDIKNSPQGQNFQDNR